MNKASNMYNTISKKVPNLHITDRLTKKPRNLSIKDVGEVYFKDLNFDYYNGDKYNWWLDHVSKKYQDENQDDLICIAIICYQIEKKLHNIKDINKIRDYRKS